MTTTYDTTDDWASAWPDALAFGFGLSMAWWGKWTTTDLVWSLWLSSLVVGYATIVWGILRPVHLVGRTWQVGMITVETSGQTTRRSTAVLAPVLILGGLFGLAFFTVHFGFFHYVHSQFLATFFPIEPGEAARHGPIGMATYLEVARRYWWFLPSALLAERGTFLGGHDAASLKKTGGGLAAYRNVMRMHVLIFFFAFARAAGLDNFAVYAVVYAAYFFPWRLVRRGE